VASLLSEAADLVEDSLNLIRALLALGHVLHADESTTRIATTRRRLGVACTDLLTLPHLAHRSRAGADAGGVLPHYRGVLVHDSLSLYAGYGSCTHQLCGAQPLGPGRTEHPGPALHDHHVGYITWQNFLEIEAKLKANCTHDGARPAREGLALCQGIIGCGSCGRPMITRYHRSGQAAYECSGSKADHQGTPTCRSIRADVVDNAVAACLLARLAPDQIDVALAAADGVTTRHTRSHQAAELAVERARYEADRAERAFHSG
jgi:hypothetical protein